MTEAGTLAGGSDAAAAATLADAYARCEAITREQAANFYWGIRLLARRRRQAMCAVYAFARRIDDIADGDLPDAERLERLGAQAQALSRLPVSPGADPVMIALADAYERFSVPTDALPALIDGVRMDVQGVRYESFEELVPYCRRVAGAIGRACLAIFALRDPARTDRLHAEGLADDLGVALQLTNILRDVREDAENGRVYLPAEDLRRFGVVDPSDAGIGPQAIAARMRAEGVNGVSEAANDPVAALVRFEAERAQGWFERGIALAPLLDRRSAACLLAMAGIYRRLLVRIAAEPRSVLHERVSLSAGEKALVAARSLLGPGASRST